MVGAQGGEWIGRGLVQGHMQILQEGHTQVWVEGRENVSAFDGRHEGGIHTHSDTHDLGREIVSAFDGHIHRGRWSTYTFRQRKTSGQSHVCVCARALFIGDAMRALTKR